MALRFCSKLGLSSGSRALAKERLMLSKLPASSPVPPDEDLLLSPIEKYQTIVEISEAVVGHTEREKVFTALATTLRERFPVDCTAITMYIPERDAFETIAIEPFSSAVDLYSGFEFPAEGSHSGWVYHHVEAVLAEDIAAKQRFPMDSVFVEQGLRSYAVLPLINQHGKPIGTFNVGSQRPGRYGEVDLEFLELVANQLALALDSIVAHETLTEREEQLRSERASLEEKDVALRQVLSALEREREEYRHRICRDVKEAVGPLLHRLRQDADGAHSERFAKMSAELEALLSRNIDDFREAWSRLTTREIEICRLIQDGRSTKEIADQFHLALVTVQTHRENIRRKLGLSGKGVNLGAYLLQNAGQR